MVRRCIRLNRAEIGADRFPQFLIRGIHKMDRRGETIGLPPGLPVVNAAVRGDVHEAAPRKKRVHVQPLGEIHLPVIAQDHKVGLLIDARVPHGVRDLAQPFVREKERFPDAFAQGAAVVPEGVDNAVVDH